ncbi:hypothetical protein AK830_g81 [Neonectria ditissima]|uniref:Zn(2)-C6 fungal-type domain-containing protein n=1 Tax=Neonectria ditissima TaxID=78410 RepID=A0A0P7BYN9_9HYPO|nr:hypothetical protein AK830_g81 [Neonectria ditissima]
MDSSVSISASLGLSGPTPGPLSFSEGPAANTRPATTDASSSTPTHITPLNHPRSCVYCRRRKVKCDRQQPCSNCVRGKLECSYPAGRGRAAKKPRKTLDGQLIERLHRLESIIRRLTDQGDTDAAGYDADADANDEMLPVAATAGLETEPGAFHDHNGPRDFPSASSHSSPEVSVDQQLGRLMIDDTRSYYVSNILWANLGNEIEELRDMLHEPVSEDESCVPSDASMSEVASPLGASTAVMGFRSLSHLLLQYHPPLSQSVALLTVFSENVLPLVHIFHMPTTSRMYWDAIGSLDSVNKNTEALLFAIYYSAVISMEPEQCVSVLGATRASSLDKYRFAVEQALARANLLNTQSIILLQAAVLFLSALRNEDDSRTTWSLTSLVFHIAQAMGLHRDGTAFGLKPFDIELRRRLWWHVCLLDTRSSEFHGYAPIVNEANFDTKLPLNIDDSHLTPQMTEPPPESDGPTEMTFCLIRCEAMRAGWKVGYAPPSVGVSTASTDGALRDREAVVEDLKQRLEERYLRHCNTSVPFLQLSSTVARLIIARIWLVVHYPVRDKTEYPARMDTTMRDRLFSTSVEVLELSGVLLAGKDMSRWTWHSKTHIQWHAVILVLSEICSRPPSPECDHAWECVNTVHSRWNMKESGKKGNLWKPIQRLMAKARYVREMQKIDPRVYNRPQSTGNTHAENAVLPSTSSCVYTPSVSVDVQHPPLDNIHSVLGMESSDNFLDLSLENLEVDMFGAMAADESLWQWDEHMLHQRHFLFRGRHGGDAKFTDGTEDTGCLLVAADGPHSTVRTLLLGKDKASVTPIDYASTMCFTKHTREHALFLCATPHNPLYQVVPHPDGYCAWLSLHDGDDKDHA